MYFYKFFGKVVPKCNTVHEDVDVVDAAVGLGVLDGGTRLVDYM